MAHLILASLSCLALALPACAAELDDTVAALRAVSVDEATVTEVPAALVAPQARFKVLLREAAIRALPDVEPRRLDLDALRPVLSALAQRYAPRDDDERGYREGPIYGSALAIRAEHPRGRPDLVAIVTNVRVGCGQDASVALLARRQGRWVDVLDIDSGAIRGIGDAYGVFSYEVSPAAADGSFVVVDAHVTPWCQSNWRGLSHEVHRVAASGKARRIFRYKEEIFLGADEPSYEIRMRSGGYDLRFETGSGSPDTIVMSGVVDVDIRGDRVRRHRVRAAPVR